MTITGGLRTLAQKAVGEDWTSATFTYFVRQTADYRRRFRGILPGMSEGEYLSLENGYIQAFRESELPFDLDRKKIAYLVRNRIDPGALAMRAQALARVRENALTMQALEQTLRAKKIIRGRLTKRDQVNLVLRKAPKIFYDVWEETVIRGAAARAGIAVGEGILRREDIVKLMSRQPGRVTEEDVTTTMARLAQRIRTLVPLSRLAKFNITERDLVEMELNPMSQRAQEIASVSQRVLSNIEAGSQPTAQPGFTRSGKRTILSGFEEPKEQSL
jgi:hypothetical protein